MSEKIAKFRMFASSVMFLTGCAGPAPIVQRVEVPVHVACVTSAPVRPAFEFDRLTVVDAPGVKVLALARDVPRWLRYEGELLAVVEGCR